MADIFELFKKIGQEKPAPAGAISHIIVGLGNPGAEYFNTRHNTGFMALDYLAQKLNVKIDRARFKALVGEATFADRHVLLMMPQTYMNLSGEAVREAADFYHIPPENVIVLCDDINLDVGRMRVRGKGSDGGHNGIKNIIYQLKSDRFPRIRIGVGMKPNPNYELADWVLSAFNKEDQQKLFAEFATVEQGIQFLLAGNVEGAMQFCNGAKSC